MEKIINFNINDIIPAYEKILHKQGISHKKNIPKNILNLITNALDIFKSSAQPVGIFSELSKEEFSKIFIGEGKNAEDTPLEHIFPKAEHLSLFAVTIGNNVSEAIENLFKKNDFALGSILDCISSLSADKCTDLIESYLLQNLMEKQESNQNLYAQSYSPGYCGWHISGQKKLFQFLHPEKIGITLNNSFLMIPLKSVSGVLITGKKDIHIFQDNYPFCTKCKTHSCQPRMKKLINKKMFSN